MKIYERREGIKKSGSFLMCVGSLHTHTRIHIMHTQSHRYVCFIPADTSPGHVLHSSIMNPLNLSNRNTLKRETLHTPSSCINPSLPKEMSLFEFIETTVNYIIASLFISNPDLYMNIRSHQGRLCRRPNNLSIRIKHFIIHLEHENTHAHHAHISKDVVAHYHTPLFSSIISLFD